MSEGGREGRERREKGGDGNLARQYNLQGQ